jgi:hypothetical protein
MKKKRKKNMMRIRHRGRNVKVTDSGRGGRHVAKRRKRIQRRNRRGGKRGDGISKELWACTILIGKLLLQI